MATSSCIVTQLTLFSPSPCYDSRKSLHIFECLLFETDDLIMRKNEKHVILCLLEVARIGARFGMEAPMLVQMERQIDREIAADNKAMGISIGTETDKMSHSTSVGTEGNLFDSDSEDEDNIAEEPLLVYGPQPQIITNDLKSLDEMVSEGVWWLGRCHAEDISSSRVQWWNVLGRVGGSGNSPALHVTRN